jgi:transcriptional regulator with XRE-family HTH domain
MNKDLGKTIKYIRQQKGLTQQILADKVGVSWEMISRYETGKSSPLHRIFDIAQALDIQVDELLQNSFTSTPYSTFVPYLTSIDNSIPIKDQIQHTKDKYLSPIWIMTDYKDVFAIKSDIINIEVLNIHENSVLFVHLQETTPHNTLTLFQTKNSLFVDRNANIDPTANIVGLVISEERRFV